MDESRANHWLLYVQLDVHDYVYLYIRMGQSNHGPITVADFEALKHLSLYYST